MDEMNTNATEAKVDWDDWDSIDFSEPDTAAEDEAAPAEDETAGEDQTPETEAEEADANEEPAEAESDEGTDQTFTLKHLDETREVSRDEVIALAQKGMDYDRIRQKLEEANQKLTGTEGWEEAHSFVQELADRHKVTVPELIDRMRAEIMARDEGIDLTVAQGRIQNQRERAALEKERSTLQGGQQEQQAFQRAVDAFVAEYPDVKAEEIPKSVWDEYAKTGDLITAWRREENRQLKEQIADLNQKLTAQENNKKNKSRTTGSQKSEGTDKPTDAIVDDWYSSD